MHMADLSLWEVLGTLPSLEYFTLADNNPPSDLVHAPENSNSQTGCSKYFVALESLWVTGSFSSNISSVSSTLRT